MSETYARVWEEIYYNGNDVRYVSTERMKVHGGWIIKSYSWLAGYDGDETISEALCFLPDENHRWKLSPFT